MTWPHLSLKLPAPLLRAVEREAAGNVPRFVRETLAARCGIDYEERPPGLAGATAATRKRVSRAGVKARKNHA